MPLKIVSDNQGLAALGTFISLPTIRRMVRNMIDNTFKRDRATGSPMPWNQHFDGRGIHFSKAEIDKLFADNMTDDNDQNMGLRIYIGMHGDTHDEMREMPDRPMHYIGQHTTILVCTKDGEDLLRTENSVSIYQPKNAGGLGLDEGQICPPPACNSII